MHENTKYFLFFKTLRAKGQFSPLPMQPLIVYQLTVANAHGYCSACEQ